MCCVHVCVVYGHGDMGPVCEQEILVGMGYFDLPPIFSHFCILFCVVSPVHKS